MEFTNKVSVITGGASGIGRSTAIALAKLGSDIVIADRDADAAGIVCREIEGLGRRALPAKCDVTDNSDVEDLASKTLSEMGKADILVTCAGMSVYGVFEKMDIKDYELLFNINFLGTIRTVLAFSPHMINRGSGYIVITSSRAGLVPMVQPYPLSKYATTGYAEGLYCYLRPKGVMVSALCPAMVNTNLRFNSFFRGNEQEIQETRAWAEQAFTDQNALSPDQVADILIQGMKDNKFLILTHSIEQTMEDTSARGRDIIKMEKYLQDTCKGS
jgi:NAD(P)-dependent dehydrogenase (short-subunit alcohol dehydrogenase family)